MKNAARLFSAVKTSLSLQILLAVGIGILLGTLYPAGELKGFSEIGKAIIHWVKLIAGPFLFLTIVASMIEVQMSSNHALRLISIALTNTAIAIVIGMGLAHLFLGDIRIESLSFGNEAVRIPEISIGFSAWIKTFMPTSFFGPFVQNEILLIAVLALLTGLALRKAYAKEGPKKLRAIAQIFEELRKVPEIILRWIIQIIPVAVLTVVAGAVSEHGFKIFFTLAQYVGVVLLGFILQIVFVYGTWIFGVAKIKARVFFREAKAPVSYAFGVNSSLATLPLTLKALKNMGVSDRSASLGAGVATNLNNDGIVLYEAMAVFFIAQVMNIPMTDTQMITAAIACIVASMGITGIPEAGFISLSVVVSTLGLPVEMLPLLLAVDWMIARGRSVVNVLSDMVLSIAMDATEKKTRSA